APPRPRARRAHRGDDVGLDRVPRRGAVPGAAGGARAGRPRGAARVGLARGCAARAGFGRRAPRAHRLARRRDAPPGPGRPPRRVARVARRVIVSRDNEKLRLVRKLHERRWRDRLGLFVCEGEDLVAAATAEPVELLVAGENVDAARLAEVSTAAHPPRVIGVYRRADLPYSEPPPVVLALWRVADPGNVGTLIRTAGAFGAAVAL